MPGEQVSYNIVQNPELKEKLKDVINNVHGPIRKELTEFLRDEGVTPPKNTPDKPVGDLRNIPEGSKLNDEEIANFLLFNMVLSINYAYRGMTESVRPDVTAMFAKYQMMKIAFSITLKDLTVRRGWLKEPPYFQAQPYSQKA